MRMTAARFRKEFRQSPSLQRELHRYTHLLMAQISQTAACNRFHHVEARLARWLLMTRDRVRSDQFRLTQDFLSHMLGVRRVGVTKAASALQKRKLITYNRGNIRILDGKGLEGASCGCYQIVKDKRDVIKGIRSRQGVSAVTRGGRAMKKFPASTATHLRSSNRLSPRPVPPATLSAPPVHSGTT